MRITGGQARGIPLTTGSRTTARPATDYLREAVFSSLGSAIQRATFIDLFAGTGAYGLEAMSRGARAGWFVENNSTMVACLRKNITRVARSLHQDKLAVRVSSRSAEWWVRKTHQPADFIFIDPPYALLPELKLSFWENIARLLVTQERGCLLLEMPGGQPLPNGLAHWTVRKRIGRAAIGQPTVTIASPG